MFATSGIILFFLFIFAIYCLQMHCAIHLDFSGGKQNHSGDVEGSKIYISNITH